MPVASSVKNDFTKGPMWQVILKMSIPMMLAQLVNVLYNVVDRMYIGHIEDVGAMALTGLGLCMPVISLITAFANLCGSGGGPLCSIARDMNAAGLVPRSGKWTPQLIRRMVRSENYIGNISYDGNWLPGKHQAIIDPAQFAAVQRIMDTRSEQYQEFNRRLGSSNSLLGGFLVCARCGAKYTKRTQKHKNKNGTLYFPKS